MKYIFTLLSCLFILSASSQQWKAISNYSLAIPQQEMGKNIQPAHSFDAGILYQLPGPLNKLSVGIESGIGFYASKRIEQTFRFDNNRSAIVPVNYNSNTFNVNLQFRFNLLNDDNFIIPYINARGGLYNFFSTVYVEDPDDPDGCRALQRKNIMNDKTMYWSAGFGLQIDPAVFSKDKSPGNLLIDISANTIRGGTLSYINTKHLIDAQSMTDGGKPLQVQFVNASTQSIHEHTVAQVYTTALRMFEIKAGVLLLFGH